MESEFMGESWERTHYGSAMNLIWLRNNSRKVAQILLEKFPTKKFIFCYSGMSGVANVTALMLALLDRDASKAFGLVYVRKEEERTNSDNREEWSINNDALPISADEIILVFVDDFICTGATLERTLLALHNSTSIIEVCMEELEKFIEKNRSVVICELDISADCAIHLKQYKLSDDKTQVEFII